MRMLVSLVTGTLSDVGLADSSLELERLATLRFEIGYWLPDRLCLFIDELLDGLLIITY